MKQTFKQFLVEMLSYTEPDEGSEPFYAGKKVKDAALKYRADNPHTKHLTVGNHAALSHSDDPMYTDRIWRTAFDEDAGTSWLKYVHQHSELHNNPFVPRLFEIQHGKIVTYQVEKLIPFLEPDILRNKHLMLSKLKQYFNNIDLDKATARSIIITELSKVLDRGDYSNIKDPQLKQALQAVDQMITYGQNKTINDITDTNLMWRMTHLGPQLVITDPLWRDYETNI